MAGKRNAPKKATAKGSKAAPELEFEDGVWYIVKGKDRTDVGRSERYARKLLAQEG